MFSIESVIFAVFFLQHIYFPFFRTDYHPYSRPLLLRPEFASYCRTYSPFQAMAKEEGEEKAEEELDKFLNRYLFGRQF